MVNAILTQKPLRADTRIKRRDAFILWMCQTINHKCSAPALYEASRKIE